MALTPSTRLFDRWRASGDADALARLFDREAPGLLRLARHLLRDAAGAEDAVQNTFLVALERAESFRGGERVEPWLAGILVKQVHRARRGAARRPDPERLERAPEGSPEAALAARELEERLDDALARLPEGYALPLRRRLLEDRTPAEIAAELELSPGAVHVRLSRGLKRLRRLLPAGLAGPALAGAGGGTGGAPAGARLPDLAAVRARVLRAAPSPSTGTGGTAGTSVGAGAGGSASSGGLAAAGPWALGLLLAVVGTALALRVERSLAEVGRGPAPALGGAPLSDGRPDPSDAPAPPLVGDAGAGERAPATDPAPATVRYTGFASDLAGGPLPGAEVWSLAPGTYDRLEHLATCDPRGAFAFEAASGADLDLGVFHDGYAPWATPLDPLQRARAWRTSCRTPAVGTTDGEVWLGQLFLAAGASVAGRVFDVHGDPVPDAELLVYPERMQRVAACDRPWGRTRSDGRFELDVRVAWEARACVLLAVTRDGRVGWATFACPDGREHVADVRVDLWPAVPVEVRVEDPDGRPVAGAVVHASPGSGPLAEVGPALHHEPNFRHAPAIGRHWTATSDARGVARFPSLPLAPSETLSVEAPARIGHLCLVAEASGFGDSARGDRIGVLEDPGSAAVAWFGEPRAVLTLTPPAAADADEEPAPLGPAAPLRVRVERPDGTPLTGLRVGAHRGDHDLGRGPLDAEGRWAWDADAGPWTVRVYPEASRRDPFAPAFLEVELEGREAEHVLVCTPPPPPPAANLRVEPTSAADGAPLDPTDWSLFRLQDDGSWRGERGSEARAVACALEATHLPPGRWRVWVSARGHAQARFELELADGDAVVRAVELEPLDG